MFLRLFSLRYLCFIYVKDFTFSELPGIPTFRGEYRSRTDDPLLAGQVL